MKFTTTGCNQIPLNFNETGWKFVCDTETCLILKNPTMDQGKLVSHFGEALKLNSAQMNQSLFT